MNKINTITSIVAAFPEHMAVQFCSRMISRGEIVKRVVQESGLPVTRLAQRLGISRGVLYNDFDNPQMSFDRILAIGKIIGHDFSQHFRDLPAALVEAVNGAAAPTVLQLQECQSKLLTTQEKLIEALQIIDRYRVKYGPETA
jgi:hypothetical protein